MEIDRSTSEEENYKSELFPDELVINDIDYLDKNQIAEQFNKYFTSIGPELASKITESDTDEDVTKYIYPIITYIQFLLISSIKIGN